MPPSPNTTRAFQRSGTPHGNRRRHRAGPPPRPLVAHLCEELTGLGFGCVIGAVITSESRGALASPGGVVTAISRFAGFTGAYSMLIMVLLIARIPWLERSVGQDRLLHWHRRTAPWAMALISIHIITVTFGYAALSKASFFRQFWTFITSYPDILASAVGFLLLSMAAITSIRIARRKLRYETWWVVHLYTYLGLSLAFVHQIMTGATFIGHPVAKVIWSAVWIIAGVVIFSFRWLQPIAKNLLYRLKIASIVEESPSVFSVVCTGKHLETLAVSGGQFFQWRFLHKGLWWQAHPYSISALPRPPFIRLTVKALGDQSAAVATLPLGTRVMIEGPYGAFTHHSRTSDRVALIAAGIGITPIRSLLEDLPAAVDVVTIVRGRSTDALIHHDELQSLSRQRHAELHEVIGSRPTVSFDARTIKRLIPDIAGRDVYVCGPDAFAADVLHALRRNRVPIAQIHIESFAF